MHEGAQCGAELPGGRPWCVREERGGGGVGCRSGQGGEFGGEDRSAGAVDQAGEQGGADGGEPVQVAGQAEQAVRGTAGQDQGGGELFGDVLADPRPAGAAGLAQAAVVEFGDGGELDAGLPGGQTPGRAEQADQRIIGQGRQAVVESVLGEPGQRRPWPEAVEDAAVGETRAQPRYRGSEPEACAVIGVVIGLVVQAGELGVGWLVPVGKAVQVQALRVRVQAGQVGSAGQVGFRVKLPGVPGAPRARNGVARLSGLGWRDFGRRVRHRRLLVRRGVRACYR